YIDLRRQPWRCCGKGQHHLVKRVSGSPLGEAAMLTLLGTPRRCCDGMTRRQSLQAGALAVLGRLGLADLVRAERNRHPGAPAGKARNVIVLFLLGGAASQDMYDLKPGAPADIRGEFRPAPSRVPGIQVCEHLPGLARWMHRVAIVRS